MTWRFGLVALDVQPAVNGQGRFIRSVTTVPDGLEYAATTLSPSRLVGPSGLVAPHDQTSFDCNYLAKYPGGWWTAEVLLPQLHFTRGLADQAHMVDKKFASREMATAFFAFDRLQVGHAVVLLNGVGGYHQNVQLTDGVPADGFPGFGPVGLLGGVVHKTSDAPISGATIASMMHESTKIYRCPGAALLRIIPQEGRYEDITPEDMRIGALVQDSTRSWTTSDDQGRTTYHLAKGWHDGNAYKWLPSMIARTPLITATHVSYALGVTVVPREETVVDEDTQVSYKTWRRWDAQPLVLDIRDMEWAVMQVFDTGITLPKSEDAWKGLPESAPLRYFDGEVLDSWRVADDLLVHIEPPVTCGDWGWFTLRMPCQGKVWLFRIRYVAGSSPFAIENLGQLQVAVPAEGSEPATTRTPYSWELGYLTVYGESLLITAQGADGFYLYGIAPQATDTVDSGAFVFKPISMLATPAEVAATGDYRRQHSLLSLSSLAFMGSPIAAPETNERVCDGYVPSV